MCIAIGGSLTFHVFSVVHLPFHVFTVFWYAVFFCIRTVRPTTMDQEPGVHKWTPDEFDQFRIRVVAHSYYVPTSTRHDPKPRRCRKMVFRIT